MTKPCREPIDLGAPQTTEEPSKRARGGNGGVPNASNHNSIPLSQWHAVLDGNFELSTRAALEFALKSSGVAVSGMISTKTTHLIVGQRTKDIEYSNKYKKAVEYCICVITEQDAWSSLGCQPPKKDERAVQFIRMDTSVQPVWRGARQIASKLSPTGRATCKGCGKRIKKSMMQIQFKENSLVQMLKKGGHESSRRGFIEDTGYPGFHIVAPRTYWVHAGCVNRGNENAKHKFERDWNSICDFIDSFDTDNK